MADGHRLDRSESETETRTTASGSAKLVGRVLIATAALALPLALGQPGCSASNDSVSTGSGASTGAGASTATGGGGGGTGGSGAGVDIDAGNTGGNSVGDACATQSAEAKTALQPADIILAVDTSGSMDQEAVWVQDYLDDFANILLGSGIDVHVVLIADSSMCVPAPLGSGNCGNDENLPAYRHVAVGVGSNDGLQKILDTYPQWKPSLRPDATKTIAIVSDDDSDLSAQAFTNALLALDPPTFQGFKFDAIVSSSDPASCLVACALNCAACNNKCCDKNLFCAPLSAAEGKVHKELVAQTGGVLGDLCDQDFLPVFQDMATGVVVSSKVSCEIPIPAVPDGGVIDPKKVNVQYSPGGNNPETVLNVPGGAADCGPNGGWYYDDNQAPTKIVLCPATCTKVQADPAAKLEVLFGCETIEQPPN